MPRQFILFCVAAMSIGAAVWAGAQERTAAPVPASTAATNAHSSSNGSSVTARAEAAERLEGETRFRANCGRCHAVPRKFPRRMMATIVRHMRVRAYIGDEDARLILNYLSQ